MAKTTHYKRHEQITLAARHHERSICMLEQLRKNFQVLIAMEEEAYILSRELLSQRKKKRKDAFEKFELECAESTFEGIYGLLHEMKMTFSDRIEEQWGTAMTRFEMEDPDKIIHPQDVLIEGIDEKENGIRRIRSFIHQGKNFQKD